MIRSKAALAAATNKQQLSGGKRSSDQQMSQQQQQLRGSKSSDAAITQQQQKELQQQLGGRRSNDQIETVNGGGGSSRKLKKTSGGTTIARNNPLLSGVHSPERQQSSLKKLPSMRGPMLSPSNSTSLTSSPSLGNISSVVAPLSNATLITGHYGHSLAAAMGATGGGEDDTEMASLGSYDDAIGSGS